jgi:hypothetical protein
MAFEDDFAALQEYYYFREFTFSHTTFRPSPTDEVELADNVIWLGDLLILFQLKQRESPPQTTGQQEHDWFQRKVLKHATKQVRDTLSYLHTHDRITLQNHRGDVFDLQPAAIRTTHKIVVYLPHNRLPVECRRVKHHKSRTAGVIHVFSADDYLGAIRTLLTPSEFADYLGFREALIERWGGELAVLPEQALVGQYLSGSLDHKPGKQFLKYLKDLDRETDDWDLSTIIERFADRITNRAGKTEYYQILREIARLNRNELRPLKARLRLSMEKAKANEFAQPYRVTVPSTNCGFVFIPVTQDLLPYRQQGLQNLTLAHKYDQKLPKCIGVSVAPEEENRWFSFEWCYLESAWIQDPELDEMLRKNNPSREVSAKRVDRYSFRPSDD